MPYEGDPNDDAARKVWEDWVNSGSPDYNAINPAGTPEGDRLRSVYYNQPTVNAPPPVPTWESERGRIDPTSGLTIEDLFNQTHGGRGREVWEQQDAERRVNAPPPSREPDVQVTPRETTVTPTARFATVLRSGQQAEISGLVPYVDPETGRVWQVPPETVKRLDQLGRDKRQQQEFENQLKLEEGERENQRIKISEMLAAGEKAYREALIAGANADRAQRAAEIAMDANYKAQLVAIQQRLLQAQEQQQGAKLALEQRQAQQQRRQQRPFAPRPTVRVT